MAISSRSGGTLMAVLAALASLAGCGGSGVEATASSAAGGSGGAPSGGNASGTGGDLFTSSSGGGPCKGLACKQVKCDNGGTTTVSGTVFDPKGDVPLYNVVVYVPNAPLEPLPEGASCDKCGSTLSGDPLVTALTDTHGRFVLANVPAGADIPLVMQVGKWRRLITLPSVAPCTENELTDTNETRLPRNQGEGSIPKIALSTGGADPLERLLRKIGIDDSEFTLEGGTGRVNLFGGPGGSHTYASALNGGAAMSGSQSLWSDVGTLSKYDVVLLACESGQNPDQKPQSALDAMFAYTSLGGRVFASHWHNYWLEAGPAPFPSTATFNHQPDLSNPFTALIDTTFPKGVAMAEWLVNVEASQTPGQLVIHEAQHTVDAVNAPTSRRWIYGNQPDSVQYFTFNTPIGAAAEEQCGRVVFSDIHVSSGDQIGWEFPNGCMTSSLSPQEKALVFMLFDLSSCIQDDDDPPGPPPT